MRNTKKYLAIALAATMAMSGSISVFADDNAGSSVGAGSSEGHVDKHVTNVVLPTIPEGTTPFAYTVDLERLLEETDGKKYGQGVVTLPSSNDTGVYFLTAGTYGYTQDTAIQSGADVSKHYTKATGYIAATGVSDGSADYYAVETVTVNTGEDVTSYFVKADNGYVAATGTAVENTTYYSMTKNDDASNPNTGVDVTGLFTSGDVYVAATGTSDGSTAYYTKAATALTYANTSSALTVTSKSSVDVKLKVEVTATKETGDITLVNAAPATKDEYALATEENGGADAANKAVANVTYYSNNTGTEVDSSTIEVGTTDVSSYYIKTVSAVTDPQLYLGLKVGSEDVVAIEAGKTVSKEVTIAGKDSNFETTVKDGQYVYGEVSSASGWNTTTFSITGAASKASAKDVNVPDLTVTWSWTDPEAGPEAPLVPTASATSIAGVGGTVDITYPAGVTISAIQKVKADGVTYNELPAELYTLTDITNGKQLTLTDLPTAYPSATKIKIVFSEGDPIVLSVTK